MPSSRRPSILLAASVPTIHWADVLLRLGVAAVLGGAVGVERELREREAGLRTHMLVALGAALFTIVSAFGFSDILRSSPTVLVRLDPSRIAAQVVSGIGFLGAGAIIRQGFSVRGLTTAASLWIVAAIGMACGAGMYVPAVLGTGIVLLSLGPLRIYAFRVLERFRPEERRLVVELKVDVPAARLLADVNAHGYAVQSFELDEERDRRIVTLHVDQPAGPLLPALSDQEYVTAVRWRR